MARRRVASAASIVDGLTIRTAARLRGATAGPFAPVADVSGLYSAGGIDAGSSTTVSPTSDDVSYRFASVFQSALKKFFADDVLTLAASLAYYTLLSFAPLMVVGVWAASLIGHGAESTLLDQIGALVGAQGREAAESILKSAKSRPDLGSVAGVVGLLSALIGATAVFGQLQSSLNVIWNIQSTPSNALIGWLRHRVLSVGVLASIGFVLATSLAISSALGLFLTQSGALWDVLNQTITTAIFAVLFGALFRYLPDARLAWRTAVGGGLATSILFALGKWAIGLYLSHGDVGGAYGAAGSLVVLLVWVYYSGAIFFFGAELTQAWLAARGLEVPPAAHAKRRAAVRG